MADKKTENEQNSAADGVNTTETLKEDDVELREAMRLYLAQPNKRKTKDVAEVHIYKIVRWMGEKRKTKTILPSEIGEFSDTHYERTATPDYEQLREIRQFLSFLRKKRFIDVSLAHHIRVARSSSKETTKVEAKISRKAIELTRDGYNNLSAELKVLRNEKVKITEDIKRAAADGDIRENSPLDAAREEMSRIMAKTNDIEATLKIAKIISTGSKAYKVRMGSKVRLSSPALAKPKEFQIVSTNEANPAKGKISAQSPVGTALLNSVVGDEVEIVVPNGNKLKYTVESLN